MITAQDIKVGQDALIEWLGDTKQGKRISAPEYKKATERELHKDKLAFRLNNVDVIIMLAKDRKVLKA
jgi:hypothetical protein